jgi:hypothetical protein
MKSQTEGLLGAYAASSQFEGSRGEYQTRENADNLIKQQRSEAWLREGGETSLHGYTRALPRRSRLGFPQIQ